MVYTIGNGILEVAISTLGAEVQSIKSQDGVEYLWQGDVKYWTGQAPNLFPYIGRLTEDCYTLHGKKYPMEKHGFMRKTEFSIKEQEATRIVLSMSSTEASLLSFPFVFTIDIEYVLVDHKLEVSFVVNNEAAEDMYFGIGAHPGFKVPLEEGLAFEDYYLEFTGESTPMLVGMSEDCYVTEEDVVFPLVDGTKIPLQHTMFDNDAIILKDICQEIRLKSDKSSRQITVTYPDMHYLGLWHMPKKDAPYICIEPWTSLSSRKGIIEELSEQKDLLMLPAKKQYKNTWWITIE